MMKLTVPASQKSFRTSKIYYVTSESKPDETHIVVRVGGPQTVLAKFFCDCRDFMIRRLSDTANGEVFASPCKHGKFVRDVEYAVVRGLEVVSAVRKDIRTVPAR